MEKIYNETIEFEIAEQIWSDAKDKESKKRAIDFYKIACDKNDPRAFLELYKINKEWATSYIITGRQHDGQHYLYSAAELGYIPAFRLLSSLENEYSTYERLVYASIAANLALNYKDQSLSELKSEFIKLSKYFAKEFIQEILNYGQNWKLGCPIEIPESQLNGKLIENPNKFNADNYIEYNDWVIFPKKEKIEDYLKLLSGYDEYCLAHELEITMGQEVYRQNMLKSSEKGNGQAMYAICREKTVKELIKFATCGSPDAFEDLLRLLSDYPDDWDFFNTQRQNCALDKKYLFRFDCLLYLYTITERLGIENYSDVLISVNELSQSTDSGYCQNSISLGNLKYLLCEHDFVKKMNERALSWSFGKDFDKVFYQNIQLSKL